MRMPKLPKLIMAVAAVVAALLGAPKPAYAAWRVCVEGAEYDYAFSQEGISWDGGNEITLDGYDGGSLEIFGEATITLVGENKLTVEDSDEYSVYALAAWDDGFLTITGDGSLSIVMTSPTDNPSCSVDAVEANSLALQGCKLNIEIESPVDATGLFAWEGITISEGASVSISMKTAEGSGNTVLFNGIRANALSVSDSSFAVDLVASNGNGAYIEGDVSLLNSRIATTVSSNGDAISCEGSAVVDNCDIGYTGSDCAISAYGGTIDVSNCDGANVTVLYSNIGDGFALTAQTEGGGVKVQHTGPASEYEAGVQDGSVPEAMSQTEIVLEEDGEEFKYVLAATAALIGLLIIASIIVRVRRRRKA